MKMLLIAILALALFSTTINCGGEVSDGEVSDIELNTFSTSKYGFSIDYPISWVLNNNFKQLVWFTHPAEVARAGVQVVINPEMSPEEYMNLLIELDDRVCSEFSMILKPTAFKFKGYSAWDYITTCLLGGKRYTFRHVVLQKGLTRYELISETTQGVTYKAELDAILDSFRFDTS